MAYRNGNRIQMKLFPKAIEDYVSKEDPVRAYDAFVEALDFNELGIILDEHKVGNSEYHPKLMLKLLLYGYSYGFRSSRKLERAAHHNLSFIWLMQGLKPDHKTIANFRKNNRKPLKEVLKQCARMCISLELIEGNTLFVDATRIRANAGIKNTFDEKRCLRYLKRADERIEEILSECDRLDEQEQDQGSLVELKQELKDQAVLKSKINSLLKELKAKNKKSINLTDKDCTIVKSRQGFHSGYNAHIAVDEKHGLITHTDVLSQNHEKNQFANQVNHANQTLNKNCTTACADAGYASTEVLKKIHDQGIKVIVPTQRQALKKPPKKPDKFDKLNFPYDSKEDCYTCPQGHKLNYTYFRKDEKCKVYSLPKTLCLKCLHNGKCNKSQESKKIRRHILTETRELLEAQYEQPSSQAIYKLREQKAELPFGHIKRNLGAGALLLRGLTGAKAEMSLLTTCFNITRMITILGGVPRLINQLSA